jgi:hypothetical protein
LIVVRQEDDSVAVDGQFLSRLFDAPLRDADPIKRDPSTKKAELDASQELPEQVPDAKHPYDPRE